MFSGWRRVCGSLSQVCVCVCVGVWQAKQPQSQDSMALILLFPMNGNEMELN